jgi:hypothetical protein
VAGRVISARIIVSLSALRVYNQGNCHRCADAPGGCKECISHRLRGPLLKRRRPVAYQERRINAFGLKVALRGEAGDNQRNDVPSGARMNQAEINAFQCVVFSKKAAAQLDARMTNEPVEGDATAIDVGETSDEAVPTFCM